MKSIWKWIKELFKQDSGQKSAFIAGVKRGYKLGYKQAMSDKDKQVSGEKQQDEPLRPYAPSDEELWKKEEGKRKTYW